MSTVRQFFSAARRLLAKADGLDVFPHFLAPIQDRLLSSPDMDKYWKKLYDTPVDSITPANKVFRVGPLLYHDNVLEYRACARDLFVRDVYSTLYELYNLDLKIVHDNIKIDECSTPNNFFFSGTPGVGTSCFRTYMLWRHIQELKTRQLTAVVWASKSPTDDTLTQLLVIEEGEATGVYEVQATDTCWVAHYLSDAKIMTLAHVDVSKGYSNGISYVNAFIRFFYTSPNEAAWKEHSKDADPSCRLYYLPEFSEDELVEYFYDMRRHPELMRRLGERKGTMVAVWAEGGGQGAMMGDRSVAREIIVEEALEYGFVPGSMFHSNKTVFEEGVNLALEKLKDSGYLVRATSKQLDDSVRHSLLSFVVDPRDYSFLKQSEWRGAYAVNRVVEEVIKYGISDNLKTYEGGVYMLFYGNDKLFRAYFVGLLAQKPSFLFFERLVPPRQEAVGRSGRSEASVRSDVESDALGIDAGCIRYDSSTSGVAVAALASVTSGDNSSSSSSSSSSYSNSEGAKTSASTAPIGMKFVPESGMAAFAADINRRGAVASINKRDYPGIDGIARFEHKGSIITAFFQVTLFTPHPIGTVGQEGLAKLKRLAETAAAARGGAMVKPHRCVFLWMCNAVVAKERCYLYSKFPPGWMEEYLVSIDMNKRPTRDATTACKTPKNRSKAR